MLPLYSKNFDLIKNIWKYSKQIILTTYYETFNEFKNKVIDFFENEITNQHHKDVLKSFIGTNFLYNKIRMTCKLILLV
ncbi:MAG TPA: hypothetical protein PLE45_01510 [Spirochaetota bacterium]|nr:hypothetical protein [Spirochaetota bacterium]HOL56639.1 hypothetical protein [Spirochaetota bacterium]HPP03729.1 hypothetical protein [Spirochaetota bacterium]